MIGVFWNPSLSSSLLMAATRPSILSEGATMSAPAPTWEEAVRARSSRVTSFRIPPVLDHGVAQDEDPGSRTAGGVGKIKARRHGKVGAAVEDHLLDAVAVPLEDARIAGV